MAFFHFSDHAWFKYNLFPQCSGAGAHLFRYWAVFLNRSIILTPEVTMVTALLCYFDRNKEDNKLETFLK